MRISSSTQLNFFRYFTGSIMSNSDMLHQYGTITVPKRKYLYDKVNLLLKKNNQPFDKAHPLLIVYLNVIAAEENIDPAVLMICFFEKGK